MNHLESQIHLPLHGASSPGQVDTRQLRGALQVLRINFMFAIKLRLKKLPALLALMTWLVTATCLMMEYGTLLQNSTKVSCAFRNAERCSSARSFGILISRLTHFDDCEGVYPTWNRNYLINFVVISAYITCSKFKMISYQIGTTTYNSFYKIKLEASLFKI